MMVLRCVFILPYILGPFLTLIPAKPAKFTTALKAHNIDVLGVGWHENPSLQVTRSDWRGHRNSCVSIIATCAFAATPGHQQRQRLALFASDCFATAGVGARL